MRSAVRTPTASAGAEDSPPNEKAPNRARRFGASSLPSGVARVTLTWLPRGLPPT